MRKGLGIEIRLRRRRKCPRGGNCEFVYPRKRKPVRVLPRRALILEVPVCRKCGRSAFRRRQ
jgi:hypothetical protein